MRRAACTRNEVSLHLTLDGLARRAGAIRHPAVIGGNCDRASVYAVQRGKAPVCYPHLGAAKEKMKPNSKKCLNDMICARSLSPFFT